MKENITLTSLSAHLEKFPESIESRELKIDIDLDIIANDDGYLFIYMIDIGTIHETLLMVHTIYSIDERKELDDRLVKQYLWEIHPYLLEILMCLIKQSLKVNEQISYVS